MKTKLKKNTDIKISPKSRITILVSQYNESICEGMLDGALSALQKIGFNQKKIQVFKVPGAFELPLAAAWAADQKAGPDGIVCLGAVIRGDTAHFDYVCQAVTDGLGRVQLDSHIPVGFGVLTVDTMAQAVERSSPDDFNKGAEATLTVLKMMQLKHEIK